MSESIENVAPAAPEVMVRVQTISDPKAFKRHLLGMFDQGRPRYADFYDADADPWNLLPNLVEYFVEGWEPIEAEGNRWGRLNMAMALTLSMPAGTDPAANEAAVLAFARREFADHGRVWVSGDHQGPFVKLLVEYQNKEGRRLPLGPSDLRCWRETYARELTTRGVAAQATTRRSRGLGFAEGRNAYKARRRSEGS